MAHEKVALITGVTGQDGSYLAEFLNKGYKVHGNQETDLFIQHGSYRSFVPGSARE